MAAQSICKFPGCGNRGRFKRGWCEMHYARWLKHGDPAGGSTYHGEVQRYFDEVVVSFEGDECLKWPYATSQGYASFGGQNACRMACERVNGPPPTPQHETAHSCGNGHLGCINPKHLRWATAIENQADRLRHDTHIRGDRHPLSKLSADDVAQIRKLKGTMPQGEIGYMFGVHRTMVGKIQRGLRWAWM